MGADSEGVTEASKITLVGHGVASFPTRAEVAARTILLGSPDECAMEADLELGRSTIGRRLAANSEYSIITNYVSTRTKRCKGVVGVKNSNGEDTP